MSGEAVTPTAGSNSAEYHRAVRQAVERKARIAELERKLSEATTELGTLRTSVGTLTTERDTFKDKLEKFPSELKETNAKLTAQIRDRTHRDAMGELLKDAKVRPDALEALLTVRGYKADEHEADGKPDVEKIKGFLTEAAKAAPWAIASESSDAAASGNPKPGPAGGRGNPAPRAKDSTVEAQIEAAWNATGRGDSSSGVRL